MTLEEMKDRKRILGYTNETLAKETGLPLSTVQKVMAGVTRRPRKRTIEALSQVLAGVDVYTHEEKDMYPRISSPEAGSFFRDSSPGYMAKKKAYTAADAEALPDGIFAEIIDGEIYYMPCPTTTHQNIIGELYLTITNYIRGRQGSCKAYLSPFAVYLRGDMDYLVPDLTVICDRSKIDDKGCHGAPDWVVEVVSPSSRKNDTMIKFNKYRDAGVREYWVIYPKKRIVIAYVFEEGSEDTRLYTFEDRISSHIYPDLKIRLADNL